VAPCLVTSLAFFGYVDVQTACGIPTQCRCETLSRLPGVIAALPYLQDWFEHPSGITLGVTVH
jgi:hypothetical protein